MHSTEQAIEAAIRALKGGMHPSMLKRALLSDGFAPDKTSVIIRWAIQSNKKNNVAGIYSNRSAQQQGKS